MDQFVTRAARTMALLGGLVLTALILIACISILGRGLNTFAHSDLLQGLSPGVAAWLSGLGLGPVKGDFELVEAGIAFSIFSFLPICQLYGAHAKVDVFTNLLPNGANRWIGAFWEVVLALVVIVIGWRLYLGFVEKLDNGQTTFLLQFPVWWAYGASLVAAVVAGLVGIYCAVRRVMEALTGRSFLPDGGSVDH